MKRAFYTACIESFLDAPAESILGTMAQENAFALESCQRDAWVVQIDLLKSVLAPYRHRGAVHFEYVIPRLGKRIDVLALVDHVLFVLEFKVGETHFLAHAVDQVWDYALDLKNFHETSHHCPIAPVLIATEAPDRLCVIGTTADSDRILVPIKTNAAGLGQVFEKVLAFVDGPGP